MAGNFNNPSKLYNIFQEGWHHLLFAPLYIVDVFFVMAGFLLAYLSMAELAKKRGKMNWVMFVIHRFLRICPIYYFTLMLFVNIIPYLGSGPGFPQYDYKYADICENYWWAVVLFISDFVPSGRQQCLSWGWFVVNDMQFYLCSPIILILHYKSKILGYGALLTLIAFNMIFTFVEAIENNYNPGVIYGLFDTYQFTHSYIRPYYRMGAYLIGMMFGFIYRGYIDTIAEREKSKDIELGTVEGAPLISTNINKRTSRIATIEVTLVKWIHVKVFRIIAYIIGIALMISILYIPLNFETNGPDSWTTGEKATYLACEHIFFSLGLVLTLMPMVAGFGGFGLKFLTFKYFAVLAKISFSYYLVHPMWLFLYTANMHQSIYLQDGTILYSFFGTVVLTTCTATILTLIIESPIMALEKALFRRG